MRSMRLLLLRIIARRRWPSGATVPSLALWIGVREVETLCHTLRVLHGSGDLAAPLTFVTDIEAAFEAARTSRGRFGRFLSRFGISGRNEIPLRYFITGPSVTQVTEAAEANLGTRPVPAQVVMGSS